MSAALVLGGAACLWDDLARLGPWDGIVVGVNEAGVHWPGRLDHLVSLHADKLPGWREDRKALGLNTDFDTWSRHQGRVHPDSPDHVVDQWAPGSSGLFAVTVAIDGLDSAEVVLAGIPMDASPHFFDDGVWVDRPWGDYAGYREAWMECLDRMKGRVWSMSGWTRDVLGAPEVAA